MSRQLQLAPGEEVLVKGKKSRIATVLALSHVVVEDVATGSLQTVGLEMVMPFEAVMSSSTYLPLEKIPDGYWEIAERRYRAIEPLINLEKRTRAIVQSRAAETGFGIISLYSWLKSYEATESIIGLVPKHRSGGRGKSRLKAEQEILILPALESLYLSKQKPTTQNVYRELRRRCADHSVDCPSLNTIRSRIRQIDPTLAVRRRLGTKAGHSSKPILGSFPGADHPLDVVQVDHTVLDIEIVDAKYRRAIGRPWITLAMDVHSRMIVGYYISLDPPGDLSTALCLIHSILGKREWLAKYDIEAEWPCHGIMRAIHVDNAREFHGKTLKRACSQYGIELKHRPVARPHYGGNVERMIGTLVRYIHNLPGTTFSNVQEKGSYDSDKHATFSLFELEKVIAIWITKIYHATYHQTIQTTPLEKYRRGILGMDRESPTTPIRLPNDPVRLRMDFLPSVERTVQPYGVVVDDIYYYHDILRPWIKARDTQNRKKHRTFLFKIDPRDISAIYFYDPDRNDYHEIPYRDITHPSMSKWDLRECRRRIKEEGRKVVNETAIFAAYKSIQEETSNSARKSRAARRDLERRTKLEPTDGSNMLPVQQPEQSLLDDDVAKLYEEPITPFRYRVSR